MNRWAFFLWASIVVLVPASAFAANHFSNGALDNIYQAIIGVSNQVCLVCLGGASLGLVGGRDFAGFTGVAGFAALISGAISGAGQIFESNSGALLPWL